MFIDILKEKNPELIKTAVKMHRNGQILPDTYIVDVDIFKENAKMIKDEGEKYGISLYYMTKQLGRNPYLSKILEKMGYSGEVTVDFKETGVMMENALKLGNVGHLVQMPSHMIEKVLEYGCEIMTVYSYEKALEVSNAAKKLNICQDIMFRVVDDNSYIYPGQEAGIELSRLLETAEKILKLENIRINGLTSFPCFLYNEQTAKIEKTENVEVIMRAKKILEEKLGIKIGQVNIPSSTCTENIKLIKEYGGTHGEPGHALTGTTPSHLNRLAPEKPAYVYVSEISHNFRKNSYFYGGGYYRRSNMKKVLIGDGFENLREVKTTAFDPSNIDYYLGVEGRQKIGDTVLGCFRTQFFVTRSDIVLVEGIQKSKPEIVGIYSALGEKKEV